jgi:hypothetical protein
MIDTDVERGTAFPPSMRIVPTTHGMGGVRLLYPISSWEWAEVEPVATCRWPTVKELRLLELQRRAHAVEHAKSSAGRSFLLTMQERYP